MRAKDVNEQARMRRNRPYAPSSPMRHLKVFAIAAFFGLCAYAVVRGLVYVSRETGLLAWFAS